MKLEWYEKYVLNKSLFALVKRSVCMLAYMRPACVWTLPVKSDVLGRLFLFLAHK